MPKSELAVDFPKVEKVPTWVGIFFTWGREKSVKVEMLSGEGGNPRRGSRNWGFPPIGKVKGEILSPPAYTP